MATIVTRAGKGSPLTSSELDQNQINLNTDKAELSGATFTGAITANAGVVVDNITIDGTEIDSSSNLLLDVAGYLDIDVDDGGSVYFSDGGITFGRIYGQSSNLYIKSQRSDKDIIFQGVDGGSAFTALTLDMSAAGAATFNSSVTSSGLGMSVNTLLYSSNASLSYYAANNAVYLNGAGDAGWLRMQASGTSNGSNYLDIYGSSRGNYMLFKPGAVEALRLNTDSSVFNEGGADVDFRVESKNNPNALFIAGLGAATNNLAVGIGTQTISNPYNQTNFTVLNIDGVWGGVISFKLGGTEKGWIGQRNAGNGGMALSSSSGNSLYLNSGGNTSRMEFTSAGDVVVNPTGANNDFKVQSNGNANALFVQGSDGRIGIGTGTSLDNQLEVAGGNIRVRGTTTPSLKFNNNDLETVAIKLNAGSTGTLGLRDNKVLIDSNGGFITTPAANGHAVFNDDGIDADFRVESNNVDHMLFVDGENDVVNIGHVTNTVGTSNGTLMVNFIGNVANGIKVRDTRGEAGTNNMMVFVRGDNQVGSITTTTSATAYNTSSDQRLKENIADADDSGELIDAIQVRKFDWKTDGSHQDYGMVAQELQTVAPEAVSAPENPDEMMAVDYSKLVPMLVKEIQTLRSRITALENA